MNPKVRFAVTGMGIVSPLGTGKETNWQRLIRGGSAVQYEIKSEAFLARVQDFNIPQNMRRLGMAFIAANEALAESGVKNSDYLPRRIALSCGESKQDIFAKNFTLENDFPQQLKRVLDIHGETRCAAAACATGSLNIIQGCRMIEEGICDAALCGGAETSIHPLYIAAFRNIGVLSKHGIRPFDKNRDGFAIGEGAAFIVVEDIKRALLRGAKIYCEITGFAEGIFSNHPLNIDSCEKMAYIIKNAAKDEIPDYIHMHGTGTKANDLRESEAIVSVFSNIQNLSVSSTKAATGHMLGVSGVVGAIFSILAMRNNIVAPTLNFRETDIKQGLNYTPVKAQKKSVNSSLSLSFGFGGQGAALYFKRSAVNSF
ncbi:MAG: beta-ketoacyl-[acyl-carrier-protein] synthase family protein [Endomicrobium sp.]|jgi:3-oxoacyl-[acyl-carrier-protein] synthase II|nr:beta-ketoacyl-[acyl-carrier-protein] synthase family protein [Endomicrobium sp.]